MVGFHGPLRTGGSLPSGAGRGIAPLDRLLASARELRDGIGERFERVDVA